MSDVDHPNHYNGSPSGVECIDVIEHLSFNVGSAMKYLWRAGLKPGESTLKDLAKASWYIERERRRLAIGLASTIRDEDTRAEEAREAREAAKKDPPCMHCGVIRSNWKPDDPADCRSPTGHVAVSFDGRGISGPVDP